MNKTIEISITSSFIEFNPADKTDFANIDDEWHDEVDALRKMCMRIKSHQVAAELLEIAWGENTGE